MQIQPTASISGSTLTYTPSSSASGTDSFAVTASDGKGGTATQTITATITAATSSTPATDFRLATADGWTGSVGGNGLIYGTSGYQDVTVLSGSVTFDASFNKGGDIVRLAGAAGGYTVASSGSSARIGSGTALSAFIPVGTVGMVTSFGDGVRKLVYTGGNFTLGGQTFSTSAVTIGAAADGSDLPTGADSTATARVSLVGNVLAAGQSAHVTLSGKATVYGTASGDVVAVAAGKAANLSFDASFNKGGDTIILDLDASSYSAVTSGSSIVLTGAAETLTIPVGTVGLTLRFADGDRTLVYAGGFKIGDQTIGTTATPLTPSGITISLDVGSSTSASSVSGAGANVTFTDDATKNSYVKITNFAAGDTIRVTGATEGQYNFSSGDLDGDGVADDLQITFSNPAAGVVNDIQILNAVSPTAFVNDKATAISAVGFNFISFG